MNYITKAELAALQDSGLSRTTPYGIAGVSQSQFSVARYVGGIKYNGQEYIYIHPTDELIRRDVFEWLAKYRKEQTSAVKAETVLKQESLL